MGQRYSFILLSFLGLLFAAAPEAQAQSSGIGLKAGGQINMARTAGRSARPMVGAVLGLYGPIYAGARFELQPEVLLSMQGRVLSDGERGFTGLRTYYLQVPISAKLFLGNTFNLAAGPQFGRLLLAQQFGDSTVNVTDDVNAWDVGFNGGLGADLRSGWDFTLRYFSGMSSVLKDDNAALPVNRSAQLTIGYRIAKWRHGPRRGRTRK
ncbi:MAG: outer membrane beta-barrel protein [Flavobacteriales bacterium]